MDCPPLLYLASPKDYRTHFEKVYCRGKIETSDGIRVYFNPRKFGHAFYENSRGRKGEKDQFSETRAQRMDWIKLTLEHKEAELFVGWNKERKIFDHERRVSVVYEDFVVVVEMSLDRSGGLKANFVTCYSADRSISRIKQSPKWNREKCMKVLKEGNCR